MRRISVLGMVMSVGMLFFTSAAHADIDVRPFLIDQSVSPREIVTTEVSITNTSGRKQNVYATVNEITVGVDGEVKGFISPIMSDRTNTVTSWIEVTRGRIEIEAGESALIPVTFRIHPQAKTGSYQAFIGFVPASKRHQAESAAMNGEAKGVVVKLTIAETISETLRLKSFSVDRFIISPDGDTAQLSIENLGDVPTSPTGEIIFYKSNGNEIASVDVNPDGNITIQPNETSLITVDLPEQSFVGRIKANAVLEYGKSRATLYDSTYFYMLPLPYIVAALLALMVIIMLMIFLMYRSYTHGHSIEGDSDLPLYVRSGNEAKETHHDIDLKKPSA